ncbi:ClbS/DfsB family four-helix bundle protein [Devosia albogilva]|uniref:ClbS/DfsB family four-helix bundle protein n=1 Tax=Devosia albogilva TaxID=429726 RepID=A0ABW5QF72_9HYPH
MPVPTSRNELLEAIDVSFDRLMADLVRVPEDRAHERSMEGHAKGTLISPADLVSYLVGWNELVLKWLERDDAGKPVDFPEAGFNWNQLGLLAQKFYSDYRHLSWTALLERLRAAKSRLVQSVSHRSDHELYDTAWYAKWTKGRMIQLNSSSPYANARGRIRRWLHSTTR